MASSTIARFVHRRDRDYWGEHCVDDAPYCDWRNPSDYSWRTAINSRDAELDSGAPATNSPLPTWESLAAAAGTADRTELQAFKKIVYYHVAQPFYSSPWLASTYWVGRDTFPALSAFSVVDATLLLSAGRPGLFRFQSPLGGHAIVLAQALSLNGSTLLLFYDNNATVSYARSKNVAPFLLLDLPAGTDPSRTCLTFQGQYTTPPNNRFPSYGMEFARLLPWGESDSQWIYGSPRPQSATAQEIVPPPGAATPTGLSDGERQLSLTHGYARLVLVGAESFTVVPEGGTTPLVAVPGGELDGDNVVVRGGAGALTTTVYLPAPIGVRYRVEIVKSATSPVLMAYEDVPAGGDSLDAIGYEALETGPSDRTRVALTVGRGNTSLDATRTSDSGVVDVVPPTFAELATLAVPTVRGLIARREGAVVHLSWVNPVHPGFSGVTVVRTAGGPARTTADGVEVFQGSGTAAEDTPASDGVLYYTVFSMSAGQPVASSSVSIVPTRACIAGSVLGDGQPVAGARITVEAQGGTLLSTVSGEDGAFSVCDLSAGRYRVSCEKTGVTFAAATQELLVGDESMTLAFEGAVVETLTLTSPVGGERWTAGSTQYVGWTTSGAIPNVRVELSRDGGATWETLSGSVPNGGALAVSVTAPKSSRCVVRVTAVGGTASSQSVGVFSIVGSSAVHRHLPR
jgi:hypothetical protein